jgi:hypothetical protein
MPNESMPSRRTCGTLEAHARLLERDPAYRARILDIERRTRAYVREGRFGLRAGVVTIPTVVHVVHKDPSENISAAQVASQLAVLNKDYRKRNTDIGKVPSVWAGLAADARVEFQLATSDPNGAPTEGIVRVKTNVAEFDTDDGVKSRATGGSDPWPTDQFLNIWVCNLGTRLLGYAQFPGADPSTDGVVIHFRAFGTTGTATAPFNFGRTGTHEVGHWLNLRHIWGDQEDCSTDDEVADTPVQGTANFGKPSFPTLSCNNAPNGDMFMNYMDYVDDDSMFMFTEGQSARMAATLDGPRSSIGKAAAFAGAPGGDFPSASKGG